ncbi:MAG: 4Fe-4S dicluster domain-containing protein [Candidatus Hydrogenedentes bacterium]|nr:4Fe-4S dicluster domain-containing protein [Candidatus Hydrogenedentota bacterium]
MFVLRHARLDDLLDALKRRGFTLVGPVVRDGAIVYDVIASSSDLPIGYTHQQDAGSYHLIEAHDGAFFGYTVGPHSWKQYLNPPRTRLWKAKGSANGFEIVQENANVPRYAFIGVRACELNAIAILDRVFLQGSAVDFEYRRRREHAFILAVDCTRPGGTCFCASMNAGPQARSGFDLALTEVFDNGEHYFTVVCGSERGDEVLGELCLEEASEPERQAAKHSIEEAGRHMGRKMETAGLAELLASRVEHPHWEVVAKRCLTCGNCTLVCPTCFCSNVEDVTDLAGAFAERWRTWDSCFTLDYSYIHGGNVRKTAVSRYRQWLTHKLSSWHSQFEMSGCVGCGRCITWCPVGIDLTEEVRVLRDGATAVTIGTEKGVPDAKH